MANVTSCGSDTLGINNCPANLKPTEPTAEKKDTPIGLYVNADYGIKKPLTGTKSPYGEFADFRPGLKKVIAKFGENAALLFHAGAWIHAPLIDMKSTKIRWFGGFEFEDKNWLNFFLSLRLYAGCIPSANAGMLAEAIYTGIKPEFGDNKIFGVEISEFAVVNEDYHNSPVKTSRFFITSVNPYIKLGENLEIKELNQLWYIMQDLGAKEIKTKHLQFALGFTAKF